MSVEQNKSIVRRYLEEVYNQNNPAVIDELLAPNYARHLNNSPIPLTRDEQRQRLAGMCTAFPDLRLEIVRLIAEGDYVAIHVILRGTHRGTFLGIEPSGRGINVPAFDIVRLENGRMVEHRGGWDVALLMQQLKG